MSEQKGPTITVTYSCSDCIYCKNESYSCQDDSGQDVYCDHPELKEKLMMEKYIGDTVWKTPDFCPFKKENGCKSDNSQRKLLESYMKWHLENYPNCGVSEQLIEEYLAK